MRQEGGLLSGGEGLERGDRDKRSDEGMRR